MKMKSFTVLQLLTLNFVSQQSTSLSSLHVDEAFDVDLLSASSMSKAIIALINKSFLGDDATTINIALATKSTNNFQVNFIVDKIIANLSDRVSLRISEMDEIYDVKLRRFYNVILVSDYESFSNFSAAIERDDFNYDGYFLFVIVEKYENQYDDMHRMFHDLWQQFVINSNILAHGEVKGEVEMFTYFPYNSEHCAKVIPKMINKFKFTKFIGDQFYEDKMKNLFGCPLRVVTFNIAPVMFIDRQENGSFVLSGIEGKLLTGERNVGLILEIFNDNFFLFQSYLECSTSR